MLVGAGWLKFQGPVLLGGLENVLRVSLDWDRAAIEDFAPARAVLPSLWEVLVPVLTLAAAVTVATVASQLAFSDGRFNGGNIAPKGSRIDPIAGLKRMFGPTGWIEMGKGLVKIGLMGTIAWYWASGHIEGLVRLGRGNLHSQLSYGCRLRRLQPSRTD